MMHRPPISARRVVTWLLAGALSLGCSEPTAPHASLSVAVLSAPIPGSTFVGGAPNWNTVTVDVLVRNESDVVADLNPCGPEVEYESPAGEWTADSKLCALVGGNAIVLPPNSERQFRETFIPPSRSATGTPVRLRLLYLYFAAGVAGRADEARSAPFELK
jgi:hypothetical protein